MPKNKRYYNDQGQRHREDGPAIMFSNGDMSYFQNGLRHRTDGPAVVYGDGKYIEYHINGIEYTEDEFKMITFFR